MADRPILFSGPMVRALLEGRKTQTRRVMNPQPPRGDHYGKDIMDWGLSGIYQDDENTAPHRWWLDVQTDVDDNSHREIDLRFAPGDRLWVREAFSYETLDVDRNGFMPPWYWADGNPSSGDFTKPKPSMHMPRWASRITLTVTEVRVQRLQEISESDAIAEGSIIPGRHGPYYTAQDAEDGKGRVGFSADDLYRKLWDSLNAARGFGWDANPWVVAVTFTVEHRNIDAEAA
jgi:hypothetical protein